MDRSAVEAWYDQNHSRYQDLTSTAETLLTKLLQGKSIPYHSVSGRLKTRKSFLDKWDQKDYSAPEDIMDVAGLRVITHTTAEVKRVCEVIEQEFTIDTSNSGDKAQNMGVDKVGYLSVHYIASMNETRLGLPEYERFTGMCFEIQVRSLLQHAWAEIEHDRNYKFASVLPKEIQRKFYLVAGTLELMDQEFCALSSEIDKYAEMVTEQTEKGELDIPIDSTSLLQYLNKHFESYDLKSLERNFSNSDNIIKELAAFGIKNLQELDELLNQKSPSEWMENPSINYIGILRRAMILKDTQKYFESAWNKNWAFISTSDWKYWEKLGIHKSDLEKYVKLTYDNPDYIELEKLDSN